MSTKKMTVEEILKEAQQKHSEIKDPFLEFGTQENFEAATQEDREKARIKLRNRYWELREQIDSIFDSKEASAQLNKWLNSLLSDEAQLPLTSTEDRSPLKATLEDFEELHSHIEDLESILLACQVAKEIGGEGYQEKISSFGLTNGFECKVFGEEFSYRFAQLRAIQTGKNPDEIKRTGKRRLNSLGVIIIEKVIDSITEENKARKEFFINADETENKEDKEDSKNTTDTKKVK